MSFVGQLRHWQNCWRERQTARYWKARHLPPTACLAPTVQVLGWRRVRIGAHATVSDGCWLNVNHRESDEPAIIIGESTFLGRRNFLSSGSLIEIGPYCLTGVDCHFLGSDHVFESPYVPYLVSGTTEGGIIRLGANCWLGASVTILKGVTVGFGSIIGAASTVTRDVPPFSLVVGSPARVVKRYDSQQGAWLPASESSSVEVPSEEAYLAGLKAKWPAIPGPRIAAGPMYGDL